jgi:hypothetical protein
MTDNNMNCYAIIGFGSLLWDLDTLRPHVVDRWEYYTGPTLPLEFSLVSRKRRGALALVIDLEHGSPCPTCIIKSRRNSISEIVIDLATREHTPTDAIGFYDRNSGAGRSHSPSILELIRNWLQSNPWEGAVWTGGRSNFREIMKTEFSVVAARDYLRSLSDASLVEAKRYIDNAPDRVDTTLRRALARDSWWRNLPP